MKILILTHYFNPHLGGIEEVALQQAKLLAKKNHEVKIVSSNIGNDSSKLTKEEKIQGIDIYRVSASDFLYKNFDIPQPIFNPLELNSVLNKLVIQSDIIHIHDRYYMTSIFGSMIGKKYGKPTVLTIHVGEVKYSKRIYKLLFKFNEKISDFVVQKADKVLVLGKEIEKYVKARYKTRPIIVFNGVDTEFFSPYKHDGENKNRKELGISENTFIVLFVGRFTYKKGADYLLKIARKLKSSDNYNKIELLLIGDGPEREKIEYSIKSEKLDNIKILGKISDKKLLANFYKISDILIFPSRKGEGSPLVILESMSSGIPVIVKNTGYHAQIIKNGKTGYVVENIDEMVDKILFLNQDRITLEKFSNNCRTYIKKYSWSKNVEELISIYSSSIKKFNREY